MEENSWSLIIANNFSSFLYSYSTSFIPTTSLHNVHPTIRSDYPDLPKENGEPLIRHRCIPRKRRVLQQPCVYQQNQQPWHDSQPAKFLAPNHLYIPPGSDISSPPVSPKTVIPISYPPPRNPCTSASSLRPCHICYRRPTTRELLDAYADCDLCGQRACYICLRQCDAMDCRGSVTIGENHLFRDGSDRLQEGIDGTEAGVKQSRKICSCCAVEGVTETGLEVVRCLECVRARMPQFQGMSGQAD